jgi:hypothetical protein
MSEPLHKFDLGDVCLVSAKIKGFDFLPCIPARRGDDALELKDGILLHCLGLKEVGPNSWFYQMEIVTGSKAGDLIFVGHQLGHLLEKVPSHKRFR